MASRWSWLVRVRHAFQTRASPSPACSMPIGFGRLARRTAGPRGGGEDLDASNVVTRRVLWREEKSLDDPGVVGGSRTHGSRRGASSGAADRFGKLDARRHEWPAPQKRRSIAAVDRHDRRTLRLDKLDDLLAVQASHDARTRRSSMSAMSKPFRFPPTSTPSHLSMRQRMPEAGIPRWRTLAAHLRRWAPKAHSRYQVGTKFGLRDGCGSHNPLQQRTLGDAPCGTRTRPTGLKSGALPDELTARSATVWHMTAHAGRALQAWGQRASARTGMHSARAQREWRRHRGGAVAPCRVSARRAGRSTAGGCHPTRRPRLPSPRSSSHWWDGTRRGALRPAGGGGAVTRRRCARGSPAA